MRRIVCDAGFRFAPPAAILCLPLHGLSGTSNWTGSPGNLNGEIASPFRLQIKSKGEMGNHLDQVCQRFVSGDFNSTLIDVSVVPITRCSSETALL